VEGRENPKQKKVFSVLKGVDSRKRYEEDLENAKEVIAEFEGRMNKV